MIIIKNKFIPLKGFRYMTVWPFLFIRNGAREMTDIDINHESIHGRQQLEMLWLPFFVWYGIEYVIRRWIGRGNAYRRISFEQEAYKNEGDLEYLSHRHFWAWVKYL